MILANYISAQDVFLKGSIIDSLQVPLAHTNVLAFPENSSNVSFAISDMNGTYSLSLSKGVPYNIEVSHIGYRKKTFQITLDSNGERTIVMYPEVDQLDEVVVRYKIPIEVKEDTIIYDTDAFVSGKERKLREVLKKLPGLEVDRLGNVTVKGKKVTTVLVEDKTFFTGNSKLAVNNIPANVVDQVEILENYNRIGMLKGLEDSNEVAMNIHLKKDRNKFTFGDIEAGGGVEDRYLVHPNVFYYSPKTNVNFIGDANNTGEKSFTLNDYIEFEGGFGQMINNPNKYVDLLNGDFARFLANDNFRENRNAFGALNISRSLGEKIDLNGYAIINDGKAENQTAVLNRYSRNDGELLEDRSTLGQLENTFVIGKLTLEYKPSRNTRMDYNSLVKWNKNNAAERLTSTTVDDSNFFNNSSSIRGTDIKQNMEYTKKLSMSQTINGMANVALRTGKGRNDWISDESYLTDFLPVVSESPQNIFQDTDTESLSIDFLIKDYWIINNLNHIYTSIGGDFTFEDYRAVPGQVVGGNREVFDNPADALLSYRYNDLYLGVQHKFLTGIFTIKSGLFYHFYRFGSKQANNVIDQSAQLLLPAVDVSVDFSKSKELNLNYELQTGFASAQQLLVRPIVSSFNQVFQGDRTLTNERYHSYSLTYSQFNLFGGLNINAALFYNKKSQGFKQRARLVGIDQFLTMTMFDRPENNIRATVNIGKKFGRFKYGLNANTRYSEFYQLIDAAVDKNISRTINLTGKVETDFETLPNVELRYKHSPSRYAAVFGTSRFRTNTLLVGLHDAFLKNFQFDADYSREIFRNLGTGSKNAYEICNASLFYQVEDSPWGFELGASNIFNTQRKQRSSFLDFLISDRSTFILPRMLLFKVAYKL